MAKIELNEYLEKLDELIAENNYEQAAYHCFYLLRQFPKNLTLYKLLGRIYVELNNLRAALNIYRRIVSTEPDNFLNQLSLSYIFEEQKSLEQSIFHSQTALFLQPENKDVVGLFQRLTGANENFSDPASFTHLLTGIHYYNEKNFDKAIAELNAPMPEHYQPLGKLFLGLSIMETANEADGFLLLDAGLNNSPYLITSLKRVSFYLKDTNPPLFKRYLDRLTALNPGFAAYSVQDNQLIPGDQSPIVIYQEWTGFQSSKLRTVWQQPGSTIIENDLSTLPTWLKLLPVSDCFLLKPDQNDNQQTDMSNLISQYGERRNVNLEADTFFQSDYFNAQIPELDKTVEQHKSQKEEQKKLEMSKEKTRSQDAAFNWIEKVVTEGIEVTAPMVASDPIAAPPADLQNPVDSSAELQPGIIIEETEENQDETELVRKAWNSFSTGNQQEGIDLYKELIEKNVRQDLIQEDLKKLLILFPENEGLKDLITEEEQ